MFVLFCTAVFVQAVHRVVFGAVAIAVVHHQSPQVQSTINCVVQVALVVHQFSPEQVHVHGQVQDTALAVVPLAHRFSVGLVFEFVLFAVPHAPSMVRLVVQVALVVHQFNPAQVQVHGQVPDTALAVVQLAHRFSVGFVLEFVLFAVPHAQATISSLQVSHV